jgi:pimeloyl-ACP methyl ester carboxylesterase
LADIVQVVYFDQRGNGRSTGGGPETWNLAQWGDDVKGLCEALGIDKPIVYGGSFGGFVAQSYATRHPDHPAKLILASTAARVDFPTIFAAFERMVGTRGLSPRPIGSIPPPRAAPSISRSASPSIVRDRAKTPTC